MPKTLRYEGCRVPPGLENGLEHYYNALGMCDDAHLARLGISSQSELDALLFNGAILDLGSGINERFCRELTLSRMCGDGLITESEVVQAVAFSSGLTIPETYRRQTLVALNPSLAEQDIRDHLVSNPDWLRHSIAADGATLPFAAGSFDAITCCGALTVYEGPIKDLGYTGQWLKEAYRILKPGGIGFFGPIHPSAPGCGGEVKAYRTILRKMERTYPHIYSLKPVSAIQEGQSGRMVDKRRGQLWALGIRKIVR